MMSWEPLVSNALGSAGAGVLSRVLTHPLDTAKARLQAEGLRYSGPIDVLRKTYAGEGVKGLYRGFSTVIVGGTPGTIIYLCSYEIFKEELCASVEKNGGKNEAEMNFAIHFASGLLAEAVACLIYVPVDVIKERLQVQQKGGIYSYRGGVDALNTIVRNEGMSGVYKGYGATLLSFGPFSALYFVFYEQFKEASKAYSKTETPSMPWLIMSSSVAGAIASFLTSPLDLAKLRLQVQRGQPQQNASAPYPGSKKAEVPFRGITDCLLNAYERGGVRGLFRGAGARVLHFVPATTVTMTTYEAMRKFFHQSLFE